MKTKILNFIGSLVRDAVVQFCRDIVEYRIDKDKFVYKSWIPFSFSIGRYVFLPDKEFYDSFNK